MWSNTFYNKGGGETIFIPTELIDGILLDDNIVNGILVSNTEVVGMVEGDVVLGETSEEKIEGGQNNNEIKGKTSCQ